MLLRPSKSSWSPSSTSSSLASTSSSTTWLTAQRWSKTMLGATAVLALVLTMTLAAYPWRASAEDFALHGIVGPTEGLSEAGSEAEAETEAEVESSTDGVSFADPECAESSRKRERPGIVRGVPVQYVHVPKAGGTTIQEAMTSWGHERNLHVLLHNGDHEGVWPCPDSVVNRGILLGHRGFGYCQRMQRQYGDRALYVVALREPVSRLRSLFDYFMENDYPFFHKYHNLWRGRELNDVVLEYNRTLNAGLSRSDPRMRGPLLLKGLANQQTAFMCGWDCVAPDVNNVTSRNAIERAMMNLQRTDVVVVMERLDDLIDQLRFHVSWVPRGIKRFPYDNTHKGKKSVLSKEAQDVIREWSANDVKLYNVAFDRHQELTNNARRCLGSSVPPVQKQTDVSS